jgi:selenide, water dikinase
VLEDLTPGSPAADGFMSSMETRDDAGYVPFGGGLLLQSVDFFPPIVDDPYRFGQIAAANALSDIYAMGGEPLTAMNLVGFPSSLDLGILREILAGGQSKIEESGAKLCGGHSVQDEEPKYGLSVTGFVEEDRVVRNAGAKVGDALVLTKPLGFGILTTAFKRDLVSEEEIESAVEVAARLNKGARDALREIAVSSATDVTGYGFLGHLLEMLEASGVGAVVRRSETPVWDRAQALAADGCYPGGLKNNREYLGEKVTADGVAPDDMLPLYDPQTSGGLLVAVPGERADEFIHTLEKRDTPAAVVGEVVEGQTIRVTP